MKSPYKASIFIFAFTLIVSAALYYESKVNSSDLKNNNKKTAITSVNVIVNQMELVLNNEQGEPRAKLLANKLKHNTNMQITNLDSPVLIVSQPEASWELVAKSGMIIHNKVKIKLIEEILLSHDVKITRHDYNSKELPYVTLDTNQISYFPQKDLFASDKEVVITSPNSVTTATGLKFNKTNQKLELLSDVVSKYDASSIRYEN